MSIGAKWDSYNIDSRIGLNSATGSSQDMSQCYCDFRNALVLGNPREYRNK